MRPRENEYVTVVDNNTKKEVSGFIKRYTPDEIVLHVPVKLNAKEVHFKEMEK